MPDLAIYLSLFLTALLAATVLPAQSEAVLVGFLLAGHAPVPLVLVASAGNVLGAVVNWLLGRGLGQLALRGDSRRHRLLARAEAWYHRHGKWSLLLSWVPVIGDPITVVAGMLRERLPTFLLLVTLAKLGRYVVLATLTLQL